MDYFGLKDNGRTAGCTKMEADLADEDEPLDLFYDRFKEERMDNKWKDYKGYRPPGNCIASQS